MPKTKEKGDKNISVLANSQDNLQKKLQCEQK